MGTEVTLKRKPVMQDCMKHMIANANVLQHFRMVSAATGHAPGSCEGALRRLTTKHPELEARDGGWFLYTPGRKAKPEQNGAQDIYDRTFRGLTMTSDGRIIVEDLETHKVYIGAEVG